MIGEVQTATEVFATARGNPQRGFTVGTGDGSSGAERLHNGIDHLRHRPKFKLDRDAPVFTIGSCFARNIEVALYKNGINCITRDCNYPGEMYELAGLGSRNGALNAYTPGSMLELLRLPLREDAMTSATLSLGDDLYADMMLHGLRFVNGEELRHNRAQMLDTYRKLPAAKTVIITLGYTECWKQEERFVNRAPTGNAKLMRASDGFSFINMSADQVLDHVREIVEDVTRQTEGEAKIIITVSPVPLSSTFTDMDVIVANDYSKATLLSAAVYAAQNYDNVDYYPSLQFISHMPRAEAFEPDGVHVLFPVVERVIGRFIRDYFEAGAEAAVPAE